MTMINDILDFSKIEAGKMILNQVNFVVRDVVEGAVDLMAARAQAKGLTLMTFVDPATLLLVRGDPGRLRQVLLNIVGNAVKFTEQGEVVVRVMLDTRSATHASLRFTVSDTGIGLSAHARQRLFQPFTQVDGSTNRHYGGTGLGLAISRQLVELMHGAIGVESVEGHGSTFWFTAHLELAAEGSPPAISAPTAGSAAVCVLLADANPTSRDIIQTYIRSWGWRCDSVGDSGLALHRLRAAAAAGDQYTAMIVDLALLDTSGSPLLYAVRHDPALATELILLTAHERERGEQALRYGFRTRLTRPLKQTQLFEAINSIVCEISPPACVTPPPIRSPLAALPELRFDAESPRILLVEDNPANRKLSIHQFEKLGYAVHAVSTGAASIISVARNAAAYGMVLMDCQMPEMDGMAATRIIRKIELNLSRRLPIIAMTAKTMPGDREACIASGMDDYVTKPVQLEALHTLLERWWQASPAPETSCLDPKALNRIRNLRLDGERDLLRELIDIYLDDTPQVLDKLQAAVASGNLIGIAEAAHRLKGGSSVFGATVLVNLCQALEEVARSGELAGAAELLHAIEAEHAQVHMAMEAECQMHVRMAVVY